MFTLKEDNNNNSEKYTASFKGLPEDLRSKVFCLLISANNPHCSGGKGYATLNALHEIIQKCKEIQILLGHPRLRETLPYTDKLSKEESEVEVHKRGIDWLNYNKGVLATFIAKKSRKDWFDFIEQHKKPNSKNFDAIIDYYNALEPLEEKKPLLINWDTLKKGYETDKKNGSLIKICKNKYTIDDLFDDNSKLRKEGVVYHDFKKAVDESTKRYINTVFKKQLKDATKEEKQQFIKIAQTSYEKEKRVMYNECYKEGRQWHTFMYPSKGAPEIDQALQYCTGPFLKGWVMVEQKAVKARTKKPQKENSNLSFFKNNLHRVKGTLKNIIFYAEILRNRCEEVPVETQSVCLNAKKIIDSIEEFIKRQKGPKKTTNKTTTEKTKEVSFTKDQTDSKVNFKRLSQEIQIDGQSIEIAVNLKVNSDLLIERAELLLHKLKLLLCAAEFKLKSQNNENNELTNNDIKVM